MIAAGFSLGGSVLLKYLGENGVSTPLDGAVAVCVPLDLHDSAAALSQGFSNIYQYHLIKKMKNAIAKIQPTKTVMAAATFGNTTP